MIINQSVSLWRKLALGTLGLGLLLQFSSGMLTAVAQDQSLLAQGSQMAAELGNRRFVGILQAQGDASPDKDAFIFKDGTFVSEGCLKWGFSPAPYWVRQDADGLRFLAELRSPEHGTMRYEGVFDGKELKGTAKWKKERWYWTMEREYHFSGKAPDTTQ